MKLSWAASSAAARSQDRERQAEHPTLETPQELGGCIGIARP
jgi:hypothetical protein